MDINKIVRKAYSRQADRDSKALPSARTRFEPPASVRDAVYIPWGVRQYSCFHGKLYYEPCKSCRRTEADALENLRRVLSRS